MKIDKLLLSLLFIFLSLAIPLFSIRGISGNPSEQELNSANWVNNGPFELSPERGRFALTYSIVENKSFYFSLPLARFTLPDLGYKNGHYISLFAPAISFLTIPGYIIGKYFGASQVGAFAVISLFAVFNFFLIKAISKKLGLNSIAATIAAMAFLFGSPAFSYGISLYQHHVSTFLLLCGIYLVLTSESFLALALVWFLFAASIPVDYPNLFLMFPVAIFALGKIIKIKINGKTEVKIKFLKILTFMGAILPLLFFLWFNQVSYGNPLQFSGTIAGVREIDVNGNPAAPSYITKENAEKYLHPEEQSKSAVGFFNSRNLINGFYMHLISPDRGMIYFTPIILLGLLGAFTMYRKNRSLTVMLLGIVGMNLLLYSMWGDPWGGWAFGSRYMIPSYAILAIFLASLLTTFSRKTPFLLFIIPILGYSIAVNTAGALSTSANPPQVEILALEKLSGKQERFSFDRNLDLLWTGNSKAFVYQAYLKKYLTPWQYYEYISAGIIGLAAILIISLRLTQRGKKNV